MKGSLEYRMQIIDIFTNAINETLVTWNDPNESDNLSEKRFCALSAINLQKMDDKLLVANEMRYQSSKKLIDIYIENKETSLPPIWIEFKYLFKDGDARQFSKFFPIKGRKGKEKFLWESNYLNDIDKLHEIWLNKEGIIVYCIIIEGTEEEASQNKGVERGRLPAGDIIYYISERFKNKFGNIKISRKKSKLQDVEVQICIFHELNV